MTDIQSAIALGGKLTEIYKTGHGTGPDGALTWDEYMAELDQWRQKDSPKIDWLPVAAWLAAQLVGERALTHADAHQAVLNIAREIHHFEERRRISPPETPVGDQPELDFEGGPS